MKTLLYILLLSQIYACKGKDPGPQKLREESPAPVFRPLTEKEKTAYIDAVKKKYDTMLLRRGFNGSILVAKNGEILLEDYRGIVDINRKDSITANTAFHIASVSKTFTGMAVMKLAEEDKIGLDDSLNVYFPGFPYSGITVRMLLSHRSGLPNYIHTMPAVDPVWKKKLATNQDMLQFLMEKRPSRAQFPNRGFYYCNTNYALLALIIEKVTGISYPDYMKNTIFDPLGMKDTYVFSIKDTASYQPTYQYDNRVFLLESMDCIYGDKNIYSTPRDLFLWDQAIYANKIVSQSAYEEATQPTSNERPSRHNYGLGWRLMMLPNNSKIVYHNGWWHGNNAVFNRLVDDTATIIILGNKFNRAIYSAMKIGTVFTNSKKTEEQDPTE